MTIERPLLAACLLALFLGFSTTGVAHAAPPKAVRPDAFTPKVTAAVETPYYVARTSEDAGAIRSLKLKGKRYEKNGRPVELVTTDKAAYLPLRVEFEGVSIPANTPWKVTPSGTAGGARYEWSGDGVSIARKLEPGKGPYQLWSTVRVTNTSRAPKTVRLTVSTHHYVRRSQEKGGFFTSQAAGLSHGLCKHEKKTERLDRDDLLARHRFGKGVRFAAVENVYFVMALAPDGSAAEACTLKSSNRGGTKDSPAGSLFNASIVYPKVTLPPGGSRSFRTLTYLGPKNGDSLRAAGHSLHEVVDLGFFSVIARVLVDILSVVHNAVGNWGLAIILLTIMVKLLLYPLTEKSFQSMAKMRQLKPEIDRINELYGDDREKKGAATMELYRKYKINPFGGCLPQLLQLPIWWALYTSLSTNVELYNAPFALWWTDLSAPDPFYTLPLFLGGLMVVQQRLTPSTMDPAQAKMMMYVMPVMITAFMLFLPAGLCLYMVTNSTLGIAQQKFIDHRLGKRAASGDVTPSTPPALNQPSEPKPKTKLSRTGQRRTRRGRA